MPRMIYVVEVGRVREVVAVVVGAELVDWIYNVVIWLARGGERIEERTIVAALVGGFAMATVQLPVLEAVVRSAST